MFIEIHACYDENKTAYLVNLDHVQDISPTTGEGEDGANTEISFVSGDSILAAETIDQIKWALSNIGLY